MSAIMTIFAPDGVPEIRRGADLADVLLRSMQGEFALEDGDIVVVTSKVVAKAEGLVTTESRAEVIERETERVVAARGETRIVRHRLGLVLAAAGVDASNVEPGLVVPLPQDPDRSARTLRAELLARTGCTVGVLITDTVGRPWRNGQTDITIGAAGVQVLDDHAGRDDGYGNRLSVTAPAVADEIAGAAELVRTKTGRRPFAVVRGRADLVTTNDDPGPGMAPLLRAPEDDMFGMGVREAVVRALAGRDADRRSYGSAADRADLIAGLAQLPGVTLQETDDDELLVTGSGTAVSAVAFAHGWLITALPAPESGMGEVLRVHLPLP